MMTMRSPARIAAISVAALFILTGVLIPAAAQEIAKLSGDFTYISNPTGITILKCKASGEIDIPSALDGKTVTEIASDAFKSSGATKINIPASVTSVGDESVISANTIFASSVEEINVESGNTVYTSSNGVLYRADEGKLSLVYYPRSKSEESFSVPANIAKISKYAAAGCKNLTQISFTGVTEEIGDGAFSGCTKLATLSLHDGLISIDSGAFKNCSALTKVTLPASVRNIAAGAFAGCSRLSVIIAAGDLSDDSLAALAGSSKSLTVYNGDGSTYITSDSGELIKSGTGQQTPVNNHPPIIAETTDAKTTSPKETTSEETSDETTEDITVTLSPPVTKIDPLIGVEITDEKGFSINTTAPDTEVAETETPVTTAAEEITVSEVDTTPETVYFVEPSRGIFGASSEDLTLIWILGAVAAAAALSAAIWLIYNRRKKNRIGPDGLRHSKYYEE
ncbi:MAG TPA: leucine-rich repeat domain-containing protein [Clostridiales bacterium]|nr:leucine-rich repeat domain-containing protein [Clostridiales bacterium]